MAGHTLQCGQFADVLSVAAACALLCGCNAQDTVQFRKGLCSFQSSGHKLVGCAACRRMAAQVWHTSRGVQCFLTPASLAVYVAAMMSCTAAGIVNVEWGRKPPGSQGLT